MKNLILPILALTVLGLAACTPSEEPAPNAGEKPAATSGGTEATVTFAADVHQILKDNCISCHQGDKAQEGIDFSSYESLMKGGEHGPTLVAGKSSDSLIVKAVTGDGVDKMPPGNDSLTPEEVEKIKAWIDAGAKE